ncbi:hypothetical protein B0J17DRAFT_115481 [Rhizoctonia solani]|nr:hypothetical protein B0J17DRAFT_115481 [Rhizoctonia solani]
MRRPKKQLGYLSLAILLLNEVTARRINNTIYDTNTARITYEPKEEFCAKWSERVFWRTCKLWAKPWRHEIYRSQGKVATYHRSLDHELSSMIIEFEGRRYGFMARPVVSCSQSPWNTKSVFIKTTAWRPTPFATE